MFSINNIFDVLNNENLNMANYNLLHDMGTRYQRETASSVLKAGPRYHKEHPPYCHCCANHDVQSRLKGHKNCPFQSCECPKCKIVKRRRCLMAEQIKVRRRQRKLAKEAAKALENNQCTVDLQINQDFDFSPLSFLPEVPFNMSEMNAQLILEALQFNNIMTCLPPAPIQMPMTDPNLQYAGITASDNGSSSVAAQKSANNCFTTTSDELYPLYCHYCANHDVQSRIKGHKKCPFKLCKCPKCKTVKQRRRLMNEQIKERRRQRKLERDAAKAGQNNEQIKERRKQSKLGKETTKALENDKCTFDPPINQNFDFAALSFVPEDPFNMPEMDTQLILNALQLDSGPIQMTMTDPILQFAGINSPDIGFSSVAASISPNDSIAPTSDEINISAVALLECMQMASLAPPPPTFSIPPPLNLCALQPGISYSSMDVPIAIPRNMSEQYILSRYFNENDERSRQQARVPTPAGSAGDETTQPIDREEAARCKADIQRSDSEKFHTGFWRDFPMDD